MFSYSTGYYVSPPDDQYLKFKNRCSLMSSAYTVCMLLYHTWLLPSTLNLKLSSGKLSHFSDIWRAFNALMFLFKPKRGAAAWDSGTVWILYGRKAAIKRQVTGSTLWRFRMYVQTHRHKVHSKTSLNVYTLSALWGVKPLFVCFVYAYTHVASAKLKMSTSEDIKYICIFTNT